MLLILDFGGANGQRIARLLRANKIYCEVWPYTSDLEKIRKKNPKGLVLVGDARDMDAPDAGRCDEGILQLGVPILGISYGARLLCVMMGGQIGETKVLNALVDVNLGGGRLMSEVNCGRRQVERADVLVLPEGCVARGEVEGVTAAYACESRDVYGLQFTPERKDPDGSRILRNFAIEICGCPGDWTIQNFLEQKIEEIRSTVGDGQAILAMSGGVDSSVCAALMHRAIGERLHCIYVDTGLMRLNESEEVEQIFKHAMGVNLEIIYAEDRFLSRLVGVTDPEQKRKIVGEEFIRVFEDSANAIGAVDFLVQGTIYPDLLESGVGSAFIKSHHNVGGLPEHIQFKEIIEPVRELFKDEVRQLGEALGLTETLVWRQPFPGPGLSVRCLGEVTKPRLDILRAADAIFREEVNLAGLGRQIWQYFAILTDIHSVGMRGAAGSESRSYDYTVVLRAVNSIDAMTATAVRLPHELLATVVERITQEVPGVNRVALDLTGKPPATIEWE